MIFALEVFDPRADAWRDIARFSTKNEARAAAGTHRLKVWRVVERPENGVKALTQRA